MKKLPYVVIFLITVAILGCQRVDNTTNADSLAREFTQHLDTLIGRFNGVDLDTLIAEPIDTLSISRYEGDVFGGHHFKWRVFTKSNTVKELIIDGLTIAIKFVKEGDLDGNGTEEWGFIPDWVNSTWRRYYVYTYNDGYWDYLFEPMSIWLGHLESDEKAPLSEDDIVQPSDVPGFIKVKFSDIRNDGVDCLVIDTLISVNSNKVLKGDNNENI